MIERNHVSLDGHLQWPDDIKSRQPLSKRWVPSEHFNSVLECNDIDKTSTLEGFDAVLRQTARAAGGPARAPVRKQCKDALIEEWLEQVQEAITVRQRASDANIVAWADGPLFRDRD